MKICFVTKYPPIEGGVSMRCFWLAQSLAERGHRLIVVTNSEEVEQGYRIHLRPIDRQRIYGGAPDRPRSLTVLSTRTDVDRLMHVPYAHPYVTTLASMATDAIRAHDLDCIFSYYLQPYGVASVLASRWAGVPFIIRHAGSDLGRLMKHREMRTALIEVFRAADVVETGSGPESFEAMGVPEERIWVNRNFPIPPVFSVDGPSFDVNEHAEEIRDLWSADSIHVPHVPWSSSRPTVGIYGKAGGVKGTFDLVRALGTLARRRSPDFQLVALSQGRSTARLIAEVRAAGLLERTWILPFVAHWRIPDFIRSCTCVCFLERDFPIAFHGPTVPREILATGRCLIVSAEVTSRQTFGRAAVHGHDALIVSDPRHELELIDCLATALRDPGNATRIGANGRLLFESIQPPEAWNAHISNYEVMLNRAAAGHPIAQRTSRGERLAKRMPLTKDRLGPRWDSHLSAYLASAADAPESPTKDAIDCLDALSRTIDHRPNTALGEAVIFDRHHNALYAHAEGSLQPARSSNAASEWVRQWLNDGKSDQLRSAKPRLNCLVNLQHFRYSVALGAPQEQPTWVLFAPQPNFMGTELVLNDDSAQLLRLCDGASTVQALINQWSSRHAPGDDDDVARQVTHLLIRLWQRGAIVFDPPTAVEHPAAMVEEY